MGVCVNISLKFNVRVCSSRLYVCVWVSMCEKMSCFLVSYSLLHLPNFDRSKSICQYATHIHLHTYFQCTQIHIHMCKYVYLSVNVLYFMSYRCIGGCNTYTNANSIVDVLKHRYLRVNVCVYFYVYVVNISSDGGRRLRLHAIILPMVQLGIYRANITSTIVSWSVFLLIYSLST